MFNPNLRLPSTEKPSPSEAVLSLPCGEGKGAEKPNVSTDHEALLCLPCVGLFFFQKTV